MAIDLLKSIWPEWEIVRTLGKGSFGVVYEAVRRDYSVESHAAIKVISIPQSEAEVESLRAEGMSEGDTRSYLQKVVNDFVSEIQLMETFKGSSNIVSVEDYKVVEKTGEIGWTIYIRMELLTPFSQFIGNGRLPEKVAIKLGLDICNALERCAKVDVIHRDVKPQNIFVSAYGDFKLGDFGIARKLENVTGGLSQKGTPNYMAPEVAHSYEYDARADQYSLGIVLYQVMNQNRLPFVMTDQQQRNPNERGRALSRRMQGEQLPPPCEASPELAQVILRACNYNPSRRFPSIAAMKQALEWVKSGQKGALPIGEGPSEADPENETWSVRRAPRGRNEWEDPRSRDTSDTPEFTGKKKKSPVLKILAIALGVFLLVDIALFVVLRGGSRTDEEPVETATESVQPVEVVEMDEDEATETTEPGNEYDAEKIQSILADAEALATKCDYQGAISLIDTGLIAYPESPELLVKKEEYETALAEKNDILTKVSNYETGGDYLSAISILKDAIAAHPNDTDYTAAYTRCCDAYKEQEILSADNLALIHNYSGAIAEINAAIAVVGSDAELSQKIQEYQNAQAAYQAEQEALNSAANTKPTTLPAVNASSSGLYTDALNPNDYYSWSYDSYMTFTYPSALYQTVSSDVDYYEVLDGYNEIKYDFVSTREAGCSLSYQKIQLKSGISAEKMCGDWYDSRMAAIVDCTKIVYTAEGSEAHYVISGYTDSTRAYSIYEVGSMRGGYFYRMVVIMPAYTDQDDAYRKDYITECLYRSCNFTGSKKSCRSFDDYLASPNI